MPEEKSPRQLDAATLGPFVARVRAERGLTQRQLAERLYVSDKTVSKWERGLSLPSVPLLVPLADALGLSISELMACEESPHEETVGRGEADRLIEASLGLSGVELTGRSRRLRAVALVATAAAWGVLSACAVRARGIEGLPAALSDPAVTVGALMLAAMAWLSLLCPETLPGYYDENRISYVAQGPFRLNLGGLARVHNGNWPHVCRAGRWGAGAAALLVPALELACGDAVSGAALALVACGALFVPVVVAGKLHE